MRLNIKSTLVLFILAVLSAPVFAQSGSEGILTSKDIALAKELIERKRNFIIIANVDLTDVENEKFWPLYEEYRMKIRAVRSGKMALIESYAERFRAGTVDDEFAETATEKYLKIQADTVKVRRKYWKKFRRIVSASKAARFYQLENKMDAEIDYVLAGGVPLVESE